MNGTSTSERNTCSSITKGEMILLRMMHWCGPAAVRNSSFMRGTGGSSTAMLFMEMDHMGPCTMVSPNDTEHNAIVFFVFIDQLWYVIIARWLRRDCGLFCNHEWMVSLQTGTEEGPKDLSHSWQNSSKRNILWNWRKGRPLVRWVHGEFVIWYNRFYWIGDDRHAVV